MEDKEQPRPQTREEHVDLSEVRKSMDSFVIAPAVPVETPMMSLDSAPESGGDATPQVTMPPPDSDG